MIATRTFHEHNFPVSHIDSVSSVIDYHVPVEKVGAVVGFDGSVVVERTAGEVLARCHDEQANLWALNLMDDIINDLKTVNEARDAYATEFLNIRRNKPTPYMDKLRFHPRDLMRRTQMFARSPTATSNGPATKPGNDRAASSAVIVPG